MSMCTRIVLAGALAIALASLTATGIQASNVGPKMTALTPDLQTSEVTKEFLNLDTEKGRSTDSRFLVETGQVFGNKNFSVVPTHDGEFIAVGTVSGYGAGQWDVMILRYDSDGGLLWARTYGGEGDEEALEVQELDEHNYVLVGWTKSFSEADVLIIKFQPDGNLIWARTLRTNSPEYGYSICETHNHDLVVCGAWSGPITYNDILVARLDADGNLIWDFLMIEDDQYNQQTARSVCEAADSTLNVVGDGVVPGGTGGYDIILLKVAADGAVQLVRVVDGGIGYEEGHSIQALPNGNFLIAGQSSGVGQGEDEVLVFETDPNFVPIWARAVGTVHQEGAHHAQLTADGGCVVAGWTDHWSGYSDQFMFKLDSSHDLEWARRVGGDPGIFHNCWEVRETASGDFVFAGWASISPNQSRDATLIKTSSSGDIPSCPVLVAVSPAIVDASLSHAPVTMDITYSACWTRVPPIITDPASPVHTVHCYDDPASVDWVPDPLFSLGRNFPNPFNPLTNLEFTLPEPGNSSLSIYDVRGSLVVTITDGYREAGIHREVWEGRDSQGRAVSPGVYFARLQVGDEAKTIRLVLAK